MIKENKLSKQHFQWQEGYGCFTYSNSDIKKVYNYIENQKEHYKKKNFKDEYRNLLKEYDVEYKEEYLFEPI